MGAIETLHWEEGARCWIGWEEGRKKKRKRKEKRRKGKEEEENENEK